MPILPPLCAQVVDNDGVKSGAQEACATISMTSGMHDIRIVGYHAQLGANILRSPVVVFEAKIFRSS
jgi:hypothetical protein